MTNADVLRPAFFAAATVVLAAAYAEEPKPWDARALAERMEVLANPAHPFRYNQPDRIYTNPTRSLLARRRAFFPGERVSIGFHLPDGARIEDTLRLRVALSLHDLDGTKLQDAGETSLIAWAAGIDGRIDWTVASLPQGEYLLAARFSAPDGKVVLTRSEIVFLTADYPRLLAEAKAAVARARERAAASDPLVREISLPSTEMLVEDAEIFWSDFGRAPRDWDFVRRQLETARAFADRLSRGEDPWRDRTGAFVKGYRSTIDDTLQPYALYVPRSYDRTRPSPLVVSLHGATSNHLLNRRRAFGLGNRPGESDYEAIRNEVAYPDVGFIVLSPYGRGEVAGDDGIGEADVLRAMEDVRRAYNVDPDRVHLTGLSMGGAGTWHLGLRYPDLFASITPVCAVADVTLLARGAQMGARDREIADLTSPSGIAENALNQRVFIFHGDEDPSVGVEHSRGMAGVYRDLGWLGRTVSYFELPGVHHFAWDFAYHDASLFGRVEGVRRDPFPERVVYRTFSPRYNKAYWLRIDRIDRGLRLARIEGVRREGLFEVRTDNLSAFSLLLAPQIAPAGRSLEVRVDGRTAFRGTTEGGVLSLAHEGGRWIATKPWTGPAEGPPDHAEASLRPSSLVQYGPHVYVYGTSDPATTEVERRDAEMLADWGPNVRARFRVLADTEVTPSLMASHGLVLVGNAATNSVVAQMKDWLPIRQDTTGTYAGGRRVAGPEAAFRVQCPNPLAPGRLVLVFGGGSPDALARLLPGNARRPPAPLADYVVADDDGSPPLEGYFENDYRIATVR
jgi:predicted esterase